MYSTSSCSLYQILYFMSQEVREGNKIKEMQDKYVEVEKHEPPV